MKRVAIFSFVPPKTPLLLSTITTIQHSTFHERVFTFLSSYKKATAFNIALENAREINTFQARSILYSVGKCIAFRRTDRIQLCSSFHHKMSQLFSF